LINPLAHGLAWQLLQSAAQIAIERLVIAWW